MPSLVSPDLTKRAPRSPRIRLGGYVLLPRLIDKGGAEVAGQHGEYKFNCPLDQRFFDFVGIDGEKLKKELAKGKGDGEILEWIEKQAKNKPGPFEITQWSIFQENRSPSDVESREYFHKLHAAVAPKREDVSTWFDVLDIDDFVTFGGKA